MVSRTEGFSILVTALFKSSLRGAARVILRVFIASSSEKRHFFEKSFFPHIIGTFTICLMYARVNPYSPITYIEFMRYSPTAFGVNEKRKSFFLIHFFLAIFLIT